MIVPDELCQLEGAVDAAAVQADDDIAHAQAGFMGRAAGAHIADVNPASPAGPIFSGHADPAGFGAAGADDLARIGSDFMHRINQRGVTPRIRGGRLVIGHD